MKLSNIKLKSKLYILAFLLLSFTVIIGIIGVIQLKKSNNEMKSMYEDNLRSIDWLNDNRNQSRAMEADLYFMILSIGDKEIQNKKFEDIKERNKNFDDNINNYKGTDLDQYESDTLATMEKSLLVYREAMDEIISLALNGKQKEALDKYRAIENVANDFQTKLKELAKYNIKHAEEAKVTSDHNFRSSIVLFVGIIVFAAILGLFISWFISKEISKPIMVAIRHIGEVADYNITSDMPNAYLIRKDEVGDLSKMVQKIEDNLRSLIKAIRDTSEQVAASSEELAATSHQAATAANEVARAIDEIAKGATEQAESTTESSDKLLQLGDLIEDDQHNIRILEDSSNCVDLLVKVGLEIISLLSKKTSENEDATNRIYQSIIKTDVSSSKISEASGLIKAISEQTNLLSLNASIEAARAGEHGKGFAVVADEIRKLAEQSASSTKIIDEMVFNLQDDSKEAVEIMKRVMQIVEEQTSHVSSTEGKFHEISNAIESSVEAVNVIIKSASTMEKKKNEVMDTIQSLSAVAQENAAGAEEASASIEEQTSSMDEIADSSESLSVLAQELQDLISKFKM